MGTIAHKVSKPVLKRNFRCEAKEYLSALEINIGNGDSSVTQDGGRPTTSIRKTCRFPRLKSLTDEKSRLSRLVVARVIIKRASNCRRVQKYRQSVIIRMFGWENGEISLRAFISAPSEIRF